MSEELERIDRIITRPGSILSSILKAERTKRACLDCGEEFEARWATICEKCGLKREEAEREKELLRFAAERERWMRETIRYADVPVLWQDTSFENSDHAIHPDLLAQATEYAKDFTIYSPSLLFYGENVGTGKTHLAVCIMNYILHQKRMPVLYLKARDLLINLRGLYVPKAETTERDYLDKLLSVPLLVMDDVGRDNPSKWTDGTYWTVFDRRLEAKLPVIVTTNKSPHDVVGDTLGDRIGHPALSRLLKMCEGLVFEVGGPDLR